MVRLYLYFPVNNVQESEAFLTLVDDLLDDLSLEEEPQITDFTGFTYGSEESLLTGYYWSTEDEEWMRDQVILLFADLELEENDPRLPPIIDRLKRKFFELYLEVGSRQQDVWCVTQTIKAW